MSEPSSENWLPVPGYEGLYEISDIGRVQSIRRRGARGGILKVNPDQDGYLQLILSLSNRQTCWKIHRLVARAFLGPCPGGMEVRHLDGNQVNNRATNLAYGTISENKLDTVRHGTHPMTSKTHCGTCDEPYDEANTYIGPNGHRQCRACRRRRNREYAKRHPDLWQRRRKAA